MLSPDVCYTFLAMSVVQGLTVTLGVLFVLLILILLVLHAFAPSAVIIDRFTVILLSFLFLVILLPTLESGRLLYFFEFRRRLQRAEEHAETRKRKGANGLLQRGVEARLRREVEGTNACLVTGKISGEIARALRVLNNRLPPRRRNTARDARTLATHLEREGVIARAMAEAIGDTLGVCNPAVVGRLNDQDLARIINIAVPVLQNLAELTAH